MLLSTLNSNYSITDAGEKLYVFMAVLINYDYIAEGVGILITVAAVWIAYTNSKSSRQDLGAKRNAVDNKIKKKKKNNTGANSKTAYSHLDQPNEFTKGASKLVNGELNSRAAPINRNESAPGKTGEGSKLPSEQKQKTHVQESQIFGVNEVDTIDSSASSTQDVPTQAVDESLCQFPEDALPMRVPVSRPPILKILPSSKSERPKKVLKSKSEQESELSRKQRQNLAKKQKQKEEKLAQEEDRLARLHSYKRERAIAQREAAMQPQLTHTDYSSIASSSLSGTTVLTAASATTVPPKEHSFSHLEQWSTVPNNRRGHNLESKSKTNASKPRVIESKYGTSSLVWDD